jgi:tetratricopeptide (TPR) repeat protein
LGLYLLMQETGNLKSVNDISDAAKLSMVTGAPNLAQALLLAAINSGNTDPSLASLERTAAARITQVNADLARLSKSTTSSDLLRAARAAFGLRQFDQSADLYRRALTAGADANEANFGIGIALARAGKTAPAREAFGKAQGAYKDVAQLWNLYTGTAGARAAAPAVSPPPAKK